MGLLDCASGASVWRGYEYFEEKKVKAFDFLEDTRIMGTVSGSQLYTTIVDIAHPRKSTCNCPHADGHRVICKHMVATYFTAFPEAAKQFCDEVVAAREEEEKYRENIESELLHHIRHMKKAELEQALIDLLFSGPEWQFDRFIRDYLDR